MTHDTKLSYESLKLFCFIMVDSLLDVDGLPPEDHPMAVLARWEAQSASTAMKSLTQGISDLLSFFKDASPDRRAEIDKHLARVGAPSVALVSAWMSRKNGKILKRGAIATDEEFERFSTLLDDPALSEEDRAVFQRLLDHYEFGK